VPILTLPDGTTFEWDGSSQSVSPTGEAVKNDPLDLSAPEVSTIAPAAEIPTLTDADVKVALNSVPPKWQASAVRFAKTLAASLTGAFIATGGTIEGVFHNPVPFFSAVFTAVIMAFQKYLSWKD
jgi:hypothetical protein